MPEEEIRIHLAPSDKVSSPKQVHGSGGIEDREVTTFIKDKPMMAFD
jgi:hypothetical protein